jgi:hypothetical protein
MWKEVVVAYFMVLSQYLHRGTEANHPKSKMISLWAENYIRVIPDMKQAC